MSKQGQSVIVVGAGAFGVSAARELCARGYAVRLMDPGPLPHPHAASTDISKMIRMDYGADELYMELMEAAFPIWRGWNERWGEELYHETGFLILAASKMRPGGFEYESFRMLAQRGHAVEPVDAAALQEKHPAWAAERYPDGYTNPVGGWAESGKVVARLLQDACAEGVGLLEGRRMAHILEEGGRARGVITENGERLRSDWVVVAAGAWTPKLLPQLEGLMWPTGQPVFHFQPSDPAAYRPPRFPPWSADIANTGWYGFPALADGTLKIANHGPGRPADPDAPRRVDPAEEDHFRAFLRESIPGLAEAPLVGTRLCLYCDTWDGNFWISRDPEREGLVVASGGSGHGFKFTPVLGGIVADVIEGVPNRFAERFAWRAQGNLDSEDARYTELPRK